MTKAITPALPVALLRDLPVTEQPRALVRHQPSRAASTPSTPTGVARVSHESQAERTAAPPPPPPSPSHLPGPPTSPSPLPAYEQGYRAGFEAGHAEGLEQGRAEGIERGLSEGREAGRHESLAQAQATQEQLTRRVQRLDQLIASLGTQISEQALTRLAAAEEDMVSLCHTVICRFLGDRLSSREGIAQSVRQAVQQCIGSGSHASYSGILAIHVNPRDLEALKGEEGLGEWFRQHGVQEVPWLADEHVRLGGCIVRTNQGSLDARLETQFATLQELLLREEPTRVSLRPPASPYSEGE